MQDVFSPHEKNVECWGRPCRGLSPYKRNVDLVSPACPGGVLGDVGGVVGIWQGCSY